VFSILLNESALIRARKGAAEAMTNSATQPSPMSLFVAGSDGYRDAWQERDPVRRERLEDDAVLVGGRLTSEPPANETPGVQPQEHKQGVQFTYTSLGAWFQLPGVQWRSEFEPAGATLK